MLGYERKSQRMTKPTTLQSLILDRKAEKGWAYADIAKRGKMSRATVYKLATQQLDGLPRQATISALARGLGLPVQVVRDAAIRSAQMSTYTEDMSDFEKVLIGHSRELTEEQRRQVLRLVEAMLGD